MRWRRALWQALQKIVKATKELLLNAHRAAIHYDTAPTTYKENENPLNVCPNDYRLTPNDGLSDLTSFAQQLEKNSEWSESVRGAATTIIELVESAVITRTYANGVPWFADNPVLEPWDFDSAGGIALYTDFQGVTVRGTQYIGWQAHWYTSTMSSDNLHPYQFVQDETTWANVLQTYWVDQLGQNGVQTMACLTLLPQARTHQVYLPLIRQ